MVLNECAQVAVLLFGGNGFTQTGQGELVEGELISDISKSFNANNGISIAILRDVPGARIPGGSEDVLLDLSVRQLVKIYQAQEKMLSKSSKI
jgi:acyl-CoA dehydrogenase